MKVFRTLVETAVGDLFRPTGQTPDVATIDRYMECLEKFDDTWQGAGYALGPDWRFAESLHAAGLLCRIQKPVLKGGHVLRVDTLFCRTHITP